MKILNGMRDLIGQATFFVSALSFITYLAFYEWLDERKADTDGDAS